MFDLFKYLLKLNDNFRFYQKSFFLILCGFYTEFEFFEIHFETPCILRGTEFKQFISCCYSGSRLYGTPQDREFLSTISVVSYISSTIDRARGPKYACQYACPI